jgi:cytochrome c peroxidase
MSFLRFLRLFAAILLALPPSAHAYQFALPPGFPAPVAPADNPMSDAKVALGCRLFFEPQLSATGRMSCATCHTPELAFTDGRARAVGAYGDALPRNVMTLANVAYSPALTWTDEDVVTLEAQAERPLFNEHPAEMGLRRDARALLAALSSQPHYVHAFQAAFPDEPISTVNLIRAIAAFERTLISGRSAFDRYVYDDERDALSTAAKEGMALFYSERTRCSSCHSGLTFSGPITHRDSPTAEALFASNGLATHTRENEKDSMGTGKAAHRDRFRVPTLRNIELTAPYMHDGRFETLEEVLAHYTSGGDPGANANAAIRPLDLTAGEQRALLEFLRSLTDGEFVTREWARCDGKVQEATSR